MSAKLVRIFRKIADDASGPDGTSTRFLHDPEGEAVDPEGGMAKSKLHRIRTMADMLDSILNHNDQLPPWVQDHIAAAYENLDQVFGYIEPRASSHSEHGGDDESDHHDLADMVGRECEIDMSPKMATARALKVFRRRS